MAAVVASYSATNRWHLVEPVLLPWTALDRAIPFIPAAMLVYVSHFVFLPLAPLLVRDEGVFRRTLGALLLGSALTNVVFVLWPTAIVRPEPPGGLFGPFFLFIKALDTTANCFPSQHVALAAIAAWGLRADGSPWARWGLLWAGAIALSTTLVKQHYFVDVPGGLAFAALAWRLSARAAPARALEGEPA